MKTNRGIFFKTNDSMNNHIHNLNVKIQNMKNHEVFIENGGGVTNTACCKFTVNNLKKYDTKNKLKLRLEVLNDKENFKEILFEDDYQDPLFKKFSIKIVNAKSLLKISYQIIHENGNLITHDLDLIDINNCLETNLERAYSIQDEGEIEISFLYRKSKIEHYMLKIANLERKILDNRNNIMFLENAVIFLEQPISEMVKPKKNFLQNSQLEVSDNIEYYILKCLGRNLIDWDYFLFFFNKIIFLMALIVSSYRPNFFTFLGNIAIFMLDFRFISKDHLYNILYVFMFSVISDIILFNFKIFEVENLEKSNYQKVVTRVAYITSTTILAIKVILIYALWRLGLSHKIESFNISAFAKMKFESELSHRSNRKSIENEELPKKLTQKEPKIYLKI